MLQLTWGYANKRSLTCMGIRDPLSLGRKVESKSSSSSGLRPHNTYPSWICINFFWAWPFFQNLSRFYSSKMSQSNMFKYRAIGLASRTLTCSCGQTFVHESNRDRDWDQDMKLQMHKKFCHKWTDTDVKFVRQPWKAMTPKEAQCITANRREFRV